MATKKMSKLISIVANSRKQADKTANLLVKSLLASHKKTALIRVPGNTAPDFTKSPYVSSMFDINARYANENNITEQLQKNDYVVVLGYSAETLVREMAKLDSKEMSLKFYNWLTDIETTTYQLKPADFTFLISDYPEDTLHELLKYAKHSEDYFVIKSAEAEKTILDKLLVVNKPKPKPAGHSKTMTLYEALTSKASGEKVSYNFDNSTPKDNGLKELVSANKLIAKRLNGKNNYIVGITVPLGWPVNVSSNSKPLKFHSKAMLNLIDSLNGKNYSNNNHVLKVKTNPANEIELSNCIATSYGLGHTDDLTYTQRMRIIETWAMQPNKDMLLNTFGVRIEAVLSLYDISMLLEKTKANIMWQPLSPSMGYVDCSAPTEVETIVQEIFDTSIMLAANNPDKQGKYLLMGHKVAALLNVSWQDVLGVSDSKNNLAGSELLTDLVKKINDYFEEKFPIFTESLK